MTAVKLHLIDGTFELFRSFYGRKDTRLAPDGTNVNAAYGVLRSTLDLLERPGVTHVAAAFDSVIESFRNDMFAGYKTGEGVDPELKAQFPIAEEVLRAEGLTLAGLRLKGLQKPFFSKGDRAACVRPANLGHEVGVDELNAGKRKLTLRFDLPRGAYATMLVKRVAGRA